MYICINRCYNYLTPTSKAMGIESWSTLYRSLFMCKPR